MLTSLKWHYFVVAYFIKLFFQKLASLSRQNLQPRLDILCPPFFTWNSVHFIFHNKIYAAYCWSKYGHTFYLCICLYSHVYHKRTLFYYHHYNSFSFFSLLCATHVRVYTSTLDEQTLRDNYCPFLYYKLDRSLSLSQPNNNITLSQM